ncbi:TetR/AcrR family transcriptional regulator [Allobranchiibius sp. GilTou38]|uniref:TetR/AcrR family transcriptional regulator n=1 Tax=Allobranchiibius sp. GilTou38 TaxID=2815210 RepID=UPI001AA0E074|nr:TetR/AcrR family transcriptional regulator [Allobranchiibius sp. GilTou38]MBO1767835.1 helix-turn-helix transcriptional regulator [Allobranchiibius sp. GilTou38]
MAHLEESLRERSKARRRKAIRREAMRLFAERGFDGATIQDIAQAAEVAPRTVSMYFPTKLDIALSWSNEAAERLAAAFHEHPELEFADVIARWLDRERQSADPELASSALAMLDANPTLRAAWDAQVGDAMQVAAESLTRQLRMDPDGLLFAVASAAVGAAITQYAKTTARTPAGPQEQETFLAYLRSIIDTANAMSASGQ